MKWQDIAPEMTPERQADIDRLKAEMKAEEKAWREANPDAAAEDDARIAEELVHGFNETYISPDTDIDWGQGADEPIACGVENPEICESCQ